MTTRASTGTSTLADDLKAWAHAQLGVDAGADAERLRAAYLRCVLHDNGNPNLSAREALLILTGRTKAARPTLALEAVEEALQREVDDFAQRFFALPIHYRRREWDQLKARGQGFVRVDARLTALAAGLDVVLPPPGEPALDELSAAICRLFVLRPAARAAARQTYLAALEPRRRSTLAQAAQALREQEPAFAQLEPELLARLGDERGLAKEKAQLQQRMQQAARSTVTPTNASSSGSRLLWLAPVLVLLSFLLRLATSPSATPRHEPVPPVFRPQFEVKDGGNKRPDWPFIIDNKDGQPPFRPGQPNGDKEPKLQPAAPPKDRPNPP